MLLLVNLLVVPDDGAAAMSDSSDDVAGGDVSRGAAASGEGENIDVKCGVTDAGDTAGSGAAAVCAVAGIVSGGDGVAIIDIADAGIAAANDSAASGIGVDAPNLAYTKSFLLQFIWKKKYLKAALPEPVFYFPAPAPALAPKKEGNIQKVTVAFFNIKLCIYQRNKYLQS